MPKAKDKERFAEENIALVHSLCARFRGRGIEYDDLFGAGCEGLCKAAEKFSPEKGFCFSTYAVPVILGEIRRLFRDGGSIKVSRSTKELYLKTVRAQKQLQKELDREPTVNEIAEKLSVDAQQVAYAVCAARPAVSLTSGDDNENKITDVPVFDNTDALYDKITVDNAMRKLDKTEVSIIKLRYFRGLTQSETAAALGVTQVNISRSERKILEKLRKEIGSLS